LYGVLFSEDNLAISFILSDGEDFIESVGLKRFYIPIGSTLLMRCNIIIHPPQRLPQRAVKVILDVVVTPTWQCTGDACPLVTVECLKPEEFCLFGGSPLGLAIDGGVELVEPPASARNYLSRHCLPFRKRPPPTVLILAAMSFHRGRPPSMAPPSSPISRASSSSS
jgi:hypothetical protein